LQRRAGPSVGQPGRDRGGQIDLIAGHLRPIVAKKIKLHLIGIAKTFQDLIPFGVRRLIQFIGYDFADGLKVLPGSSH
jgi:hypothetical protein